METILTSKITAKWAGLSLLKFLSTRFKYHTESEWRRLISEGKVRVNDAIARPDDVLSNGDSVSYAVVLKEPPVNSNIRIVHDDEFFVVASKPPNLPSHADGNFITHTFIYILNQMICAKNARPYKLINRLDRETSGLIIASNNVSAHKNLARQLEAGQVHKEYIAVVRGEIRENTFTVDGPIVSDTQSKISIRRKVGMKGMDGVRTAVTSFEVIERLEGYTVLRCIPKSGKTAQIRVHLAHAGYPLAGDKLYGQSDEEFLEYVSRVRAGNYETLPWMDAPRQMLHAFELSFAHPISGELLRYSDPLPEDIRAFIEEKRIAR